MFTVAKALASDEEKVWHMSSIDYFNTLKTLENYNKKQMKKN